MNKMHDAYVRFRIDSMTKMLTRLEDKIDTAIKEIKELREKKKVKEKYNVFTKEEQLKLEGCTFQSGFMCVWCGAQSLDEKAMNGHLLSLIHIGKVLDDITDSGILKEKGHYQEINNTENEEFDDDEEDE